MTKFTPTARTNECPVCGDISGNCRTSPDDSTYVQCLTNSGTQKFEFVNGFKNIGLTSDGLWAQMKFEDSQDQATADELAKLRAERKTQADALIKAGLSSERRHDSHCGIIAQLSLDSQDREGLLGRGLTEEDLSQFVSIHAGQTLDLAVDTKTPGVGFGGRKLLTPLNGFLIPVRDDKGLILGFQIANRDRSSGAKYRWLSVASSTPVNLPNGEMPLAYCDGASDDLYLCEGTLKPFVASKRLGVTVVGASGGLFATSRKQLTNYAKKCQGDLILCPDGGALSNPHVMRQYSKLNELLQSQVRELKVLWWGQLLKSDGDIDEISAEQFAKAQHLPWSEFKAMVPEVEENKPAVVVAQKDTAKEQTREHWLAQVAAELGVEVANLQDGFDKAQLLPATETRGKCKTLSLAAEGQRKMIFLDAQKACSKSSISVRSLVDGARAKGLTSLIIVPTRLLAKDAANVLGSMSHLDRESKNSKHVVTCPESLYKFAGKRWDIVVLDEANEDFFRVLEGGLGTSPESCRKALSKVLRGASTICLSTDRLYRATIQAAQRLANISPTETETLQVRRPKSEMTVKMYVGAGVGGAKEYFGESEGKAQDAFYCWFASLAQSISRGERVAVPCGSQTRAREIDRVLRSLFFSEGLRGQLFDGKYTPASVKNAFAEGPDYWLEENQPSWVIWSPVFNSGLSIQSDYFDAQYECLSAFEGASAASQRGERVRAVLGGGKITERHVYISGQGLPSRPDPKMFTRGYWEKLASERLNSRTSPLHKGLLTALNAGQIVNARKAELYTQLEAKPELPEYWAIAARELFFKLECLTAEWESNGWSVHQADLNFEDAEQWRAVFKEQKQKVVLTKSRALAKAKPVESEGDDLSPFQAIRHRKFELGEQLGHDFSQLKNSEWLEAWDIATDSSGGIQAQRVNTLVRMSQEAPGVWEALLQLSTLRAIAEGTKLQELPALPVPSRDIATAKLLIECPGFVEAVTGTTKTWCQFDPWVKQAAEYLKEKATEFQALTRSTQRFHGLSFTEKTTLIGCVNKALKIVGVKAEKHAEHKKVRHYRLETASDIEQKHEAKLEKGKEITYANLRDLTRASSLKELQSTLTKRVRILIGAAVDAFQPIAEEIAAITGGTAPSLMPPSISEERKQQLEKIVARAAEVTQPDSLEKQRQKLMRDLAWYSSSLEDYSRARAGLEAIGLDFERECWPKLSIARQEQICSYAKAA